MCNSYYCCFSGSLRRHCICFLLVLFIFPLQALHAQEITPNPKNNNIKNEILNYKDSPQRIIENARNLLVDSIKNNDIGKTIEIENYFYDQFKGRDIIYLWIFEKILLNYLRGDFQTILRDAKGFSYPDQLYFKIIPPRDTLYLTMRQVGVERKQDIENKLADLDVDLVDKEFLFLFLDTLIYRHEEINISQEDLNHRAEAFLERENASERYEKIVNAHVRVAYKSNDFYFGVGFFSGVGSYYGNLKNEFSTGVPLGFKMSVGYKKADLSFKLYTESTPVKNDFTYGGQSWDSSMDTMIEIPQFLFGYNLLQNKRFSLTPYGGIAFVRFVERSKEVNDSTVETSYQKTPVVGVNFSYNFYSMIFRNRLTTRNTFSVNMDVSYIKSAYDNQNDPFSGDMLFLTIGIGGNGQFVQRLR